jgi:hypothetical protein
MLCTTILIFDPPTYMEKPIIYVAIADNTFYLRVVAYNTWDCTSLLHRPTNR